MRDDGLCLWRGPRVRQWQTAFLCHDGPHFHEGGKSGEPPSAPSHGSGPHANTARPTIEGSPPQTRTPDRPGWPGTSTAPSTVEAGHASAWHARPWRRALHQHSAPGHNSGPRSRTACPTRKAGTTPAQHRGNGPKASTTRPTMATGQLPSQHTQPRRQTAHQHQHSTSGHIDEHLTGTAPPTRAKGQSQTQSVRPYRRAPHAQP